VALRHRAEALPGHTLDGPRDDALGSRRVIAGEGQRLPGPAAQGDEVVRAIGKRLEHFTPAELDSLRVVLYESDNDNCAGIFNILRPLFPASELRLIDLICRMFIQPQVQLNPTVLAQHLHQVKAEKQAIMATGGTHRRVDVQLAAKVRRCWRATASRCRVKISPATGDEIPALAKNDRAFKEMLMDESLPLVVQALLAARVNSKSTLEETRTEKLLQHSLRDWHADESRIIG
jgi:hypothetical protein